MSEHKGTFPAAYIYVGHQIINNGTDQLPHDPVNGYIHWSSFLYKKSAASNANMYADPAGWDAFRCPSLENGGLPPTDTFPANLDSGQQSQYGSIVDQQAPRIAYTVNDMPRNKFLAGVTIDGSNVVSIEHFVRAGTIKNNAATILATEFPPNWKLVSSTTSGDFSTPYCKSHRPVHGFYGGTKGGETLDANYSAGAWNSGGVNNLVSQTVAVTATVFAANPGTGLTQINKTDAQWLQTTGRLKNGVDFNMTERDSNSGMRNLAALNTGVDPGWAVGENDGGNGYAADGVAQSAIGVAMKFSGKTAGGGLLRPTVRNNRMAVGVLGMSDAIGSAKNNSSTTPLRALAYSNTTDSQSGNYVQPTTATITDGSYVIWQKEQYVTDRTPDANYGNSDSIKGDATGDIAKLRNNVIQSVQATFQTRLRSTIRLAN